MGTQGSLELRIHKRTWYASTSQDGYQVYEAIPKLAEFLNVLGNPTEEQFDKWFRKTSKELFPYNYSEDLIGGVPDEVIIDVPRRLILHTHEDSYEIVSEEFPAKLENACTALKSKYNFEILNYVRPEVRELLKDIGL